MQIGLYQGNSNKLLRYVKVYSLPNPLYEIWAKSSLYPPNPSPRVEDPWPSLMAIYNDRAVISQSPEYCCEQSHHFHAKLLIVLFLIIRIHYLLKWFFLCNFEVNYMPRILHESSEMCLML